MDLTNIFVVSDGSKDATASIVRAAGANVLELNPNRGKAGALAAGIDGVRAPPIGSRWCCCWTRTRTWPPTTSSQHFRCSTIRRSLPSPGGRAPSTTWHRRPGSARFLLAYRERLYLVVQLLVKFGQAAKWANAVTIVPGFASMYRTRALAHIDVVGAGLVIEDFNMTFEVHAKKLGRIEFHPWAAVAYTQDPDNLNEYVKQVRRWILGFWQTVRRHQFRASVFWFALMIFIFELITSSLMFVLVIPAMVATLVAMLIQSIYPDPTSWTYWLSGSAAARRTCSSAY